MARVLLRTFSFPEIGRQFGDKHHTTVLSEA
jgi:chromosomal replication initiation ATPase DnaA